MRKKILYTFLLLLSSPVVAHDLEGINLDLTRVIFDSQQNSASIKVNNFNENKSWLLRSWISNYSDDGKSKSFINLFSELMCLQFHQKRLVMIKPVRNLLMYNLQLIAESNSFIGLISLTKQTKLMLHLSP